MFRYKICLLLLITLTGLNVFSQEEVRTRRRVVKARAPVWKSEFGIGAGYMLWSERIYLRRLDATSEGVANYGGPAVFVDWRTSSRTWIFSLFGEFATGKAASGAYAGNLTFEDGINRNWSSFRIGTGGLYRVNPIFSMGLSLTSQYRIVDWEPKDATLTVEGRSPLLLYPKLDLRLRTHPNIELSQSYAPLSFRGESLWLLGLTYIL